MPEALQLYGVEWPAPYTPLQVDLTLFRCGPCVKLPNGQIVQAEAMGKPHHFRQIVKNLWGPRSKKYYQFNPWNERMLEEACSQSWLCLSGCASSGKSDFLAMWALVNWLAAPVSTGVLCTSTSLNDSRRRIWGRIEEYWMATYDKKGSPTLPGKLVSSSGKLRTVAPGLPTSDRSGIFLVSGEKAREKQNIGKLIGFHNKYVIFLCDEMPELSPALIEAAQSNLNINQNFQWIGSGNFKSIYDPFGELATPVNGWGSVTPDMDDWLTTKGGKCLRFDGLKSPNILADDDDLYPGIYSSKDFHKQKDRLGEHSAGFWRMCRSYPCQEADADRIYSEKDFIKGDCSSTVRWLSEPVKVAALDPAFATGGDKAAACFGLIGMSTDRKQTLQITALVDIQDDVRIVDESRPTQVAKGFRRECEARGVKPENAAFDGSGGGIVFGSLLTELWSSKLLSVQFGGSASMRPASVKDRRPSKEVYTNRVGELWFSGLQFVQSGQIKGMVRNIAAQLTERRYETTKGQSGLRNKVETKQEMKLRIKQSPDDADAFVILLDLVRERHSFKAEGMEGKQAARNDGFKKRAELANKIYRDINYAPEEVAA